MKLLAHRPLTLLVGVSLSISGVAVAFPSKATSVTVVLNDNTTWNVSFIQETLPNAKDKLTLEFMPWLGSQVLADEFSQKVAFGLGAPNLYQNPAFGPEPLTFAPVFLWQIGSFTPPYEGWGATAYGPTVPSVPIGPLFTYSGNLDAKDFDINGAIAVASPVPAPVPLPVLGIAAAIGFGRRLRKRVMAPRR